MIVILSLPTEVIMEVFKKMGWRDILRASQACRRFFEIAQDRSIWIHLRDDPTLLYRPILEAPIEEYTTRDLKDTFLRNISSTLGWNSPRKPQERTTPHGDFPVGERGTVLLEGGRWLLSFGRNLTNYNPNYHGAVLAHDLDSPRFASTIIYKDVSPEHDMVPMDIYAQVDRSQSYPAFTVGLLFEDPNNFQTLGRFDVLRIEQRGRGPEAELVTSTVKSLSCGLVHDMVGDYITTYLDLGNNLKILNWRTSSELTLNLKSGARVGLLPENKVFAFEDCNKIAIYRIPESRWARPLEVSPAGTGLQQPIWSASLYPQVQDYSAVGSSKPCYGPFATRLAFTHNDQIYGLVIPHDGRRPALHVLATAPELSDLMRSTLVTVYVDKIYGEPKDYGLKASMLAFSWPEDADLAQPTAWVPPILHFTHKQFAGHHTSARRDHDLVDEVSGRVVIGSKYRPHEFLYEVDGVKWSDITSWSVVDFFHPQFLPSSFKS